MKPHQHLKMLSSVQSIQLWIIKITDRPIFSMNTLLIIQQIQNKPVFVFFLAVKVCSEIIRSLNFFARRLRADLTSRD